MSRTKWYRLQKKAKDERPVSMTGPRLRLVHSSDAPRRLAWVLRADPRGVRAAQVRVRAV